MCESDQYEIYKNPSLAPGAIDPSFTVELPPTTNDHVSSQPTVRCSRCRQDKDRQVCTVHSILTSSTLGDAHQLTTDLV